MNSPVILLGRNNKTVPASFTCFLGYSREKIKFNPYYPNFEFFHKNLRFGVFLSDDDSFKNSKKYALMVPGPKY